MTKRIYLTFDELTDAVIKQLKEQNYMDSTLIVYRRTYCRIHNYMKQIGIIEYTPKTGKDFLSIQEVQPSTFSSYKCAVRRLNDFYNQKEYRCHHENENVSQICDTYQEVLKDYLNYCRNKGNKPGTIVHKQKACTTFLNALCQNGYSDISMIDTDIIVKALLLFSNKDRYADIKMLLRYLYENGMVNRDYSEIIPRFKRRIPIPTVYTVEEIKRTEEAIDTSTDTGKRNIAIIRLATRMGLRSGDIARLRTTEIDFKSGYISIVQEKTNLPLELQMPAEVSDSIYMHLENSKKNHDTDDYVFHSMSAPYGRLTTSIIRHIVNESMSRAGIDTAGRKHGPHAFRSSLASLMIQDDCSYETVRRILGHSDPNVIKHYAKTDIEKLRLCAIEPPEPGGLFSDYLTGKKVFQNV